MGSKQKFFTRLSVLTLAVVAFLPLVANAANITGGSLTLGDSRPGQATTYAFSGSGFTASTIRCIQLRFAINADGTGGAPASINTSGATLSSATLVTAASWTVGNTADSIRATNATGATPSGTGNIIWGNVVNGSTAGQTYFGLFNTYSNVDCATGPVDSTVVAFTYKDGALVSLTVDPTLSFTVAGVASGQTVNGATTTLASTASAINFARAVTASQKGVSAHDLTVATNGSGFSVYIKQSGGLSNGTRSMTTWTGTNASPTPFPAAGTEAWGYTTADSSLENTSNRFTTASNWAGMPLVNELVADNNALGSQTTRVGHQLGISNTTPAGNYTTTIVYTAAGNY